MENEKVIDNTSTIMNREEVIEILKDICADYSDILGKVILFGSNSRDEAMENTDVDLYIEPKNASITTSRFRSNRRYCDYRKALHKMIPLSFDMLAYGGKRDLNNMKKTPLWAQIEKDGIVIYDQGAKTI